MTDTQQISLGVRLRRERESHHWTQEQLAEKIGGSVPSINRWEHDRTIPRPDMLNLLTDLFGKPPEQWGTIKQVLWNVPYLRNPYFTGREQTLLRLHQALAAEQTVALSQTRAIGGLGGIGKTQTAIEYAYRYANEYEAVLWVHADSAESLVSDFAALASVLELPEQQEQDQHRVVVAVKRWLQAHGPCLLIFDNADDLTLVSDFLPRHASGAILLTTRSQITGPYMKKIELNKMSREEGIAFLLHRVASGEGTEKNPRMTTAQQERDAAEALWELMDGLPLALDQAAAYSEATGCSFADYLLLYRSHRAALLRERGALVQEHPAPVASTWSLSFQQLEQRNPAAAELLRLCSFLHPDAIPQELLITGAPFFGPLLQPVVVDAFLLNQAIEALRTYSLLHRDGGNRTLSLHRLVQAVLQDALEEVERRSWAERALLAVNAAFPVVGHGHWPQCERLLPHALLVAQHIEINQMACPEAARLLYESGLYLRERARYAEAEPLFLRSVSIWEQTPGSEQPDVAYPLYGLALLYREQGKYEQAELLYQRAICIWEKTRNTEHPDFTYPLNGLAHLYREQSKYEQAELLFQRAIRVLEQAYNAEHPDVAHSLNGLALLYCEQGKYEQAELLYQRTLRIWEQVHGPEHPWVAYALDGLANVYRGQGKYEQAEPLYQRTILIWEKAHGPEHPWIGVPLDDLANLYCQQGRYEQAEALYQRAIRIREKAHGPEHPDVAYSLNSLANLYCQQGRYEQAEALYQRAIHIRKQCLGPQHPKTVQAMHDFALFQEAQVVNDAKEM